MKAHNYSSTYDRIENNIKNSTQSVYNITEKPLTSCTALTNMTNNFDAH